MSETAQQYELAYHLSPALDEAGMTAARDEISKIVTSHGGTVSFTRDPEKTRLSYPIKHQRQSWFGYTHFGIEDREKLQEIDEQMRLDNNVIRYLLVVRDYRSQTQGALRTPSAMRPHKQSIPRRQEQPSQVAPQEMEKQLEEVIEKL
ncbi:MAG: 30S ribosomal protein S6 [Patescibacteria group bacterium]